MEHCSRQCLRRTLYAVLIGVSPVVICLLLIALARLILHRLELSYYRRQKASNRRSSSVFYRAGRPTLSYTPVSTTELQRIIQGEHQSKSSSSNTNDDTGSPKCIKSMFTQRDQSLNTLANLVMRRDGINSNSLSALFSPVTHNTNQLGSRRPSVITVTHELVETTALATINDDFFDSEQTENDQLLPTPNITTSTTTTTTTTTVVVEEFLDFHSVSSLPCSLDLMNSFLENDF